MLPIAVLVAYPIALHSFLLHRECSQSMEVVDCAHELTFVSSCCLFSRREKTLRGWSACKIKYIT